jgi:UDP-N-acetylglucosamine--dolichyl-phosphate N-acetylglucosaminephosphotransferase
MVMSFTSIIVSSVFAFVLTYLITPRIKSFLEEAGLVGTDLQKKDKPKIAEMGGLVVVFGTIAGLFLFIGINTFLYGQSLSFLQLLAAMLTFLIAGLVGFFDDLSGLAKAREGKKGFESYKRVGIRQWKKALLVIPAAVPLMAIMAGTSTMTFPLIGQVDIGLIYPLIAIPIAVFGAANALNMLAGLNGLEAGTGAVLMLFLGVFSYLHGQSEAAILAFVTFAALLAFLKYNWYPAKIFPGDSLTYTVGAIAAAIAIIGNIEKFALMLFAPWFLELFLKARSKFKAESFGQLQSDGTLKAPYPKVYSITHIVMKLGRFKERQISAIIVCSVGLWGILALLVNVL